jgi:crotonobetainyl-CoA:carnitine CoA-transferase CaiB-like acyl-CoA transferase
MFQTADGYINIAAAGELVWARFCKAAKAEELLTHPDYATPEARIKNRKALGVRLAEIIKRRPASIGSARWTRPVCRAVRSTRSTRCSRIRRFSISASQHRSIIRNTARRKWWGSRSISAAIRSRKKLKHTPEQGEHTNEILKSLGYDEAAIASLRAKRVV